MKTKFETAAKFAVLAVMLGALGACASAADPAAMAVTAPAAGPAFPAPLQHAMCVRNVAGGEETNPMWASKVDDKGFRAAIASSLDSAGLTAPGADSCHFPIDVNLLGLSQPSMGLDMTVTSHVNYKVYDTAGQPLLLETIDTPYTAKFSDAFAGVKRLQLANEGSIRESIRAFFDKLRATAPK
jgi:hypothetical protein